eukprot:TRINITY_DN16000_c0_g2_i1.p1 TRINITY_DN16000_c0_g2~~TRINITY_DN16000_c0_g2_i1.p1  ORF type:complete len:588 (+),score=160.91 TRINITY_DN16000_c0_g2_i1:189-1952(+)
MKIWGSERDVVLPLANHVLLEGDGHAFEPSLSRQSFEGLRKELDTQVEAWRAIRGTPASRWEDFCVEELSGQEAQDVLPNDSLTVICPGGCWHYDLRMGGRKPGEDGGDGTHDEGAVSRRVRRYTWTKGAAAPGLWWRVSLCEDDVGTLTGELEVNPNFIWQQYAVSKKTKQAMFTQLLTSLMQNAQALVEFLNKQEGSSFGVTETGSLARTFYPGIIDSAKAVQEHYDQKIDWTRREKLQEQADATANIRSYNNLVKTLLLEQFVDVLEGPLIVLDLACGKGQDLNKWSNFKRRTRIQQVVCVDFAEAAVKEARKRYFQVFKSPRPGEVKVQDYEGFFYVGDAHNSELYDTLLTNEHPKFHVVSIQFALHYLAESERAMSGFLTQLRRVLRPDSFVLGTTTSCEALAELCTGRKMDDEDNAAPENEPLPPSGDFGNKLYNVKFTPSTWTELRKHSTATLPDVFGRQWGIPYCFSLHGAVDAQQEYIIPWDAFETLAEQHGFEVVAYATFPELFQEYAKSSPFYRGAFRAQTTARLTPEEEEVFRLYCGFVLRLRPGGDDLEGSMASFSGSDAEAAMEMEGTGTAQM